MAKILVIRFSALGDVAMTIPVLCSLATQYPEHEITVVSRKAFKPLFIGLPDNIKFYEADLKGEHKGIWGLNRLFKKLQSQHFDYVADLHNVLRTRFLCLRFNMCGIPVERIYKDRIGKWKLVRKHHKIMASQKSSFRRYEDVLRKLGFPIQLNFLSIYGENKGNIDHINGIGVKGDNKWIGIAPFAKHRGKIYPLHLMEKVVEHFAGSEKMKVFLFGGGKEEEDVFLKWESKYPSVMSMIGKLNMNTELALMSHFDVMLTMDSANMHLASLVNIPVVSVWGATHPYCGFMGWKQSPLNAIQTDIPCRPCSVFGNKPCYRKDYACLNRITPEMIISRIESNL